MTMYYFEVFYCPFSALPRPYNCVVILIFFRCFPNISITLRRENNLHCISALVDLIDIIINHLMLRAWNTRSNIAESSVVNHLCIISSTRYIYFPKRINLVLFWTYLVSSLQYYINRVWVFLLSVSTLMFCFAEFQWPVVGSKSLCHNYKFIHFFVPESALYFRMYTHHYEQSTRLSVVDWLYFIHWIAYTCSRCNFNLTR
jgi:hypothetical protein